MMRPGPGREETREVVLAHRVDLRAGGDPRRPLQDPDLACDGLRRQRVVTGDDDDPDARRVAAGDGVRDFGARWVGEGGEPEEREARLGLLASGPRPTLDVALGEAEHAQAAGRVTLEGCADLGAVLVAERPVALRAADRAAALQQLEGGALRVVPEPLVALAVECRHPLQPRVEVIGAPARLLAFGEQPFDVLAEGGRGHEQRALARISTAPPPTVLALDRRVVAAHGRAQQARERLTPLDRTRGRIGEVELGSVGPQQLRAHAPLGQRAGLVAADDVGRAERLHRGQALDERPPPGHAPDADRQRERDRRQEPLRDVRHEQADREGQRVLERQARGCHAEHEEDHAGADRHDRDELRGTVDLRLQRADLAAHPLRECCDPPELGAHPGRVDDGLGFAGGAERPGEDEILGVEQARRRAAALRASGERLGLAGQRRHVDLERAVDQPRVRGQPVALAQHHDVAGNERRRVDLADRSGATDTHARGQHLREGLRRPLGLELLREREDGVEHDHGDDRRRQDRRARQERQQRRDPQQRGERVGELPRELAQMARPRPARDLVGPVLREPAVDLAPCQAFAGRPQIAQQRIDAFLGIEPGLCAQAWHGEQPVRRRRGGASVHPRAMAPCVLTIASGRSTTGGAPRRGGESQALGGRNVG